MVTREEKLDTLQLVIEKVSNAGLACDMHCLYMFATERWGTEYRKFQEYLKILILRKFIVVDKDEIWSYARWQKIRIAREKDFNKMIDLMNS